MASFENTGAADNLTGTASDDWFGPPLGEPGSGNDRFSGKGGDDEARGGEGFDTLIGGDGRDFLYGGEGQDILDGGGDDDWINPGTGNDTAYGGAGSNDRLELDFRVTMTVGPGLSSAFGSGFITRFSGFEVFYLSDFSDRITGSDDREEVYGGKGNDTLTGQGGNDAFYAGDGRDWLYGGADNDFLGSIGGTGDKHLYGGDGNDSAALGSGNDWVEGGAGNDFLGSSSATGDISSDTIYGQTGNDTLGSSGGNDQLFGGVGRDKLSLYATGTVKIDLRQTDQTINLDGYSLRVVDFEDLSISSGGAEVTGTESANRFQMLWGDDTVRTLGGNDYIEFGLGEDTIYGGAGADTLLHIFADDAAAADVLFGGGGKDTFVFKNLLESGPVTGSTDTIADFTSGEDKIDLRGTYTYAPIFRLIEYSFIGSGPFTGAGDEVRFADGLLTTDVDGDLKADFALFLTGVETLAETDLLL